MRSGDNILDRVGDDHIAASTMVCVPTSFDQEVGTAIGAQAGEGKLREIVMDGDSFTSFRRATETPFKLILEGVLGACRF
jgi:hypothetical protein